MIPYKIIGVKLFTWINLISCKIISVELFTDNTDLLLLLLLTKFIKFEIFNPILT